MTDDSAPLETPLSTNEKLARDMATLQSEVAKLNQHQFVRIHNSYWRLIIFQFFRGLAFGLGTVVGATILVSLLVYMLSSIDFIPILGEWAAEIAAQITAEQ